MPEKLFGLQLQTKRKLVLGTVKSAVCWSPLPENVLMVTHVFGFGVAVGFGGVVGPECTAWLLPVVAVALALPPLLETASCDSGDNAAENENAAGDPQNHPELASVLWSLCWRLCTH